MSKVLIIWAIISYFFLGSLIRAQNTIKVSDKVSVEWNKNIETYFIAERLAVQNIGHMVFTKKDSLYSHQPLVYDAYFTFKSYENTSDIKEISELITIIRENLHDNAQVLQYLLHLKSFPEKGEAIPFKDSLIFYSENSKNLFNVTKELSERLRLFYIKSNVEKFLNNNKSFYEGALKEVAKDIKGESFAAMERYYGESFAAYKIYIMPTMPIPYGDDNYRAFGPTMNWPEGRVSAMVMSGSRPVNRRNALRQYNEYGFNNPEVTKFLTVHEMGHSFVNPNVKMYEKKIQEYSNLFTDKLKVALENSYVGSWYTCVIEHLVRLGEIRTRIAIGDFAGADRIRNIHTKKFHFILLPYLESKITQYEQNRPIYPDFRSFLPSLFSIFETLTPQQIDELLIKGI